MQPADSKRLMVADNDRTVPIPNTPLGTQQEPGSAESAARRRRLVSATAAVALGVLGLIFLFHPMLRGGFDRLPGDLGDARFNHYLLEHTWLWLLRRADHARFWDLPVFHPEHNVTAYSDTMLSSAPPYWAARVLSLDAATAYQLWFLGWAALNYAGGFLLLRRLAHAPAPAAAIGAFVLAYGGARAIHLTHAQLLPHAFSLACLGALAVLIADRRPRPGVALLAGLAAAAQLWTGFYLGFFLVLGVLATLLAALTLRDTRGQVVAAARRNALGLLSAAVVSLAVLAPLVLHYARAAAALPMRPYEHTWAMIPTPDSWLRMGSASWIYGWLERPALLSQLGPYPGVPIGAGWVTSFCAAVGLWQGRRRPWVRVVLVASAALLLVTLRLGPLAPWRVVWELLPGASAARAVFRVALILLLPMALGVALFLQGRKRRWVAVLCAAAIVVEQGTSPPAYSVREAALRASWLAARVPAGCSSFFFVPMKSTEEAAYPALFYHVDAMAAQLVRGVPTVNGYSGQLPADYPLYEIVVRQPEHHADVQQRLAQWAAQEGLAPPEVCVVEGRVPFL